MGRDLLPWLLLLELLFNDIQLCRQASLFCVVSCKSMQLNGLGEVFLRGLITTYAR